MCVAVGGIIALIFKLTGATDIETLRGIFEGVGWWKYIVFVLLGIVLDLVLSFFPFTSLSFIVVGALIFNWWTNFILNTICILAVSFILYFLGRKFGNKIGNKLVGEEDMARATRFLNTRGLVYLPVMFLFPFFPDDALCIVAGASKMKISFFSIVTCICRPIGILTLSLMFLLFGEVVSIMDIFTTILDTLGVLTGSVVIICMVLTLLMTIYFIVKIVRKLANKVDLMFIKRREQNENIVTKDKNT